MANHVAVNLKTGESPPVAMDLVARLIAQLRGQFYLGQLRRGDRLPPVRQLARDLRVATSTALEIYRKLGDRGIVASRERSGMFFESAGLEQYRSSAQSGLLQLLGGTSRKLKLQGVDVERFTRLLLRFTGRDARTDFKFACVTCRESYELLMSDLRAHIGFNLPIVHISPECAPNHSLRRLLASDRSIRCILTTFLQSSTVFDLATALNLPMIMVKLDPSISELFTRSDEGRRYIVTRDRDCAESLRRVACSLFSPRQEGACLTALDDEECARCERRSGRAPSHLSIAALNEPERLSEIDRDASVVYAPVTAFTQVQARYGSAKTVVLFAGRLSQDSAEDILFQYVLADS
jgi:GntR family transcriptional regulator